MTFSSLPRLAFLAAFALALGACDSFDSGSNSDDDDDPVDIPTPTTLDETVGHGYTMHAVGASQNGTLGGLNVVDYFVLDVTEATAIRLDLASGDFDAFLTLATDDGTVVAWNDDPDDGSSTDAAVAATLAPGRYLAAVRAYAAGESGAYTLTSRAE